MTERRVLFIIISGILMYLLAFFLPGARAMTGEQIAFNVGYGIGMFGPILLALAVIVMLVAWMVWFMKRCDRD